MVATAAPRLAAAEVSQGPDVAARWMAEKQQNELELVAALRTAFEHHDEIQKSVREFGLILIGQLATAGRAAT